MTSRRRFVEIMPFAGLGLLAACGDKKAAAPEPAGPAAAPTAPAATTPPPIAAIEPSAPSPSAPSTPSGPATGPTAAALVDEKSEKALSLGYVSDAKRADATKYRTHAAGQACSNCALFQGQAGDASGLCPLFAGSKVSAKAWCSAYSKKAT